MQDVIQRLGIENRLQAAGKDKALGNPFTEWDDASKARTKRIMESLHTSFINFVKGSRADRLKGDDDFLFNGEVWTGKEALEHGIIDGIEIDLNSFVKKKFGDKVKIVEAKQRPDLLSSLFRSEYMVATLVSEILNQVEDRLTEPRWTDRLR